MSKETQSKKDNSSTSAAKHSHPSKTKSQAHPSAILQRAEADIAALSSADVLMLQKTVGNRALSSSLLAQRGRSGNPPAQRPNNPVQPKLTVGPAGDKYEQEADQVAAQVMRTPEPSAGAPNDDEIGPKAPNEPLQRTPIVQRQPQSDGFDPGSDFQGRLESKVGGGRALPAETRSFMEPRFGTDFNNVRVHTDSEAVQLNRDISAQAFTHGSDVFFGAGKYNPGSEGGKQLLAHELTHVVQQSSGVMRKPTIQRLMSSVELKRLAGEPKADRGKGWFKKKMSTAYKLVLQKLDVYNGMLGIDVSQFGGYRELRVIRSLSEVSRASQLYLNAHGNDNLTPYIQGLINEILVEREALREISAHADQYPDMPLDRAIVQALPQTRANMRFEGITNAVLEFLATDVTESQEKGGATGQDLDTLADTTLAAFTEDMMNTRLYGTTSPTRDKEGGYVTQKIGGGYRPEAQDWRENTSTTRLGHALLTKLGMDYFGTKLLPALRPATELPDVDAKLRIDKLPVDMPNKDEKIRENGQNMITIYTDLMRLFNAETANDFPLEGAQFLKKLHTSAIGEMGDMAEDEAYLLISSQIFLRMINPVIGALIAPIFRAGGDGKVAILTLLKLLQNEANNIQHGKEASMKVFAGLNFRPQINGYVQAILERGAQEE